MKKKLTAVISMALLSSLAFSMTACSTGDTNVLLPKKTGNYSATVTELAFSGSNNYYSGTYYDSFNGYQRSYNTVNRKSYSKFADDDNGTLVLKYDTYDYDSRYDYSQTENTTYKMFDLKTNSFTGISSSDAIHKLSNGLFYSVYTNSYGYTTESSYTLYSNGSTMNSGVYGKIENNMFISDGNVRTYTDYNGNVKSENDAFKPILKEGADVALETDNYVIVAEGNMVYSLFEKDSANYLYSVDVARLANIAVEADASAMWCVGDKVFFQTKYQLPWTEEKYDYFDEDGEEKYNFHSYSYDLSDYAEDGEQPDFVEEDLDFVVSSSYDVGSPEFEILYVQSIDDNFMLTEKFVQSYDADGNVYVDIQALVPGAVAMDVAEKYVYILDAYGKVYIYSGEEMENTFNSNFMTYYEGKTSNAFYFVNNKNLYVYNAKGNQIHSTSNVIEHGKTNDDNIWYKTQGRYSDMVYLYVYNPSTQMEESIASWVTNETEQNSNHNDHNVLVGVYDDFCIIKNVDWTSYYNYGYTQWEKEETYSVHFMANVTDSDYNNYDAASYFGKFEVDNTTYNVFMVGTKREYGESNYEWTYKYYTVTTTEPTYDFVAAEK